MFIFAKRLMMSIIKLILVLLTFLLIIPTVSAANVGLLVQNITQFTEEEQAVYNFLLNYNYTTNIYNTTNVNWDNVDILWVHYAERISQNLTEDLKNKTFNSQIKTFLDSGGKLFLTKNAIGLLDYLNVRETCPSYWCPGLPDRLGISFINNSTTISNGFELHKTIYLWQQVIGCDHDRYFCNTNDSLILATSENCGPYESCESYTPSEQQPGILLINNSIVAFKEIRYSSQYNPSPEAFQITDNILKYLAGVNGTATTTTISTTTSSTSTTTSVTTTTTCLNNEAYCTAAEQCCGMGCENNVCCTIQGIFCINDNDCCSGLTCQGNTCQPIPMTTISTTTTTQPVFQGEITDIETGTKFLAKVYVEYGQPITTLQAINFTLFIEDEEIWSYLFTNHFNGSYSFEFDRPKMVGDLTLYVNVSYGDETLNLGKKFEYTTRHGKKLLLVTDDNFWNILYASQLPYPVLRYNDGLEHIKNFKSHYHPNEVFYLGINRSDGFRIANKEVIEKQFPGKGYVVIDNVNRTMGIFGSILANLLNYRLTASNDVTGNVICTFDCGIDGAEILNTEEKLENRVLGLLNETQYFMAVNTENNISSLSAKLVSLKGAFPIAFSIQDSTLDDFSSIQDKIREKIYKVADNRKLAADYKFEGTIFLALLGMPFGVIDDPQDEIFYNVDGHELYTDNFYGEIDNDPFLDLAVGRFAGSQQIANIPYWDPTEKDGVIIAEYGTPEFLDVIHPGGMFQGFVLDFVLTNAGFNLERIVERRFDLSTVPDEAKLEFKDWKKYEKEWIRKSLDMFGVGNVIRWTSDFIHALYEYDWEQTFKRLKTIRLEEISRENIIKELPGETIVFYFGTGDKEKWFMPGDVTIFDPYPILIPKMG
jgi:hypothetical protein